MVKIFQRVLSATTAVAMALCASSSSLQVFTKEIKANAVESQVIYGDVNGDKKVNIIDLSLIKKAIINPTTISIDLDVADVNGDGQLDVKDATEVQDFVLKRITAFSRSLKNKLNAVDRSIMSKSISGNEISGYDIQVTKEMATLAESLKTPQEIFKYVANNVNTEFYYGLRKGSIGTYEQNSGNDYDQSCLLFALLNYMGYTATCLNVTAKVTANDLISMTTAENVDSAVQIYTSQGRKIEKLSDGTYQIGQVGVFLVYNEESYFLDPSFKQYTKRSNATNIDEIFKEIEQNYSVDEVANYYDLADEIDSKYSDIDLTDVFPQYEIAHQEFAVPTYTVTGYSEDSFPPSDMIELYLGDNKVVSYPSAYLYDKNLTIEYELTENALLLLEDSGINSVDDLTSNLGAYNSWAQINAVVKLDGKKIFTSASSTLGEKENLRINIISGGATSSYEKELTYGALYSVVFDYQIISAQDIAVSYSKLPQSAVEQNKFNENNIYGSDFLMNSMTLLGKSYFAQLDTNNKFLAEVSESCYNRAISVAVIDFTPDIYTQLGFPVLNRQGKFGIDVLGNNTIFTSRKGDTEEESKLRHSTGYLSSFYESEVIQQFTGLQTVSTVEVLKTAEEQGIDILYLSKANISELDSSGLSSQNKNEIKKLINEGNYITVPKEDITIGDWTGTGYIVYNPKLDGTVYTINNNLNGGSLCSWVGLSYLCVLLLTVVESTWAIDVIVFGISLTMGATTVMGISGIVIGISIIALGGLLAKSIGDSFYESTELMNRYIDGEESAGILLQANSVIHSFFMGTGVLLARPISELFSLFHLERMIGRFCAHSLTDASGSYVESIQIINKISPKYASMLSNLIYEYGFEASEIIVEDYENKGIEKVTTDLDNLVGGVTTEPTIPTIEKGSLPKGEYTSKSSAGLRGQDRAADKLANAGFDVVMLKEVTVGNKGNGYGMTETSNPDFLIKVYDKNHIFDCFTPDKNTGVDAICRTIRKKTITQADRIILNLDIYESDIQKLKETILRKTDVNQDLKRLKELIVILPDDNDDNIQTWFLR
jgi:hypothetical protein